LNRREKIKLLHSIKEGKIRIENLQPPQVYIFDQISDNPPIYEMNDKEYNEIEYKEFCEKIRAKNNKSIIWKEGKEYPKEDIIITAVPAKGCNPLIDTFS